MSKQGQISEEAASIRALIDLSDLITICPCLDIVRKSSLNLMICSIIASS
jgi:nitric oxide reductase NorQ protein